MDALRFGKGFIIAGLFFLLVSVQGIHAQELSSDFELIPNRDININLLNPRTSGTWDYILEGNLCFTSNPPSANGKFRIELTMDLINPDDPNEVIGASVTKIVTNPATLRCGSSRLRRAAFSAPFNLPDPDRWPEACPVITVRVTTSGPWGPIPQEEVAILKREFLCPGGAPGTPPGGPGSPTTPPGGGPAATSTPVPVVTGGLIRRPVTTPRPVRPIATAAPTAIPTSAPTPTPKAGIEGYITVFSCQEPENLNIEFCSNTSTASCYNVPVETTPSENGIWLHDELDDRTLIYKYKITEDQNGDDVIPGRNYVIRGATATIEQYSDRSLANFQSSEEPQTVVQVPSTRDLTIYTSPQTCSCTYHVRASVIDADTGRVTNVLDETPVAGRKLTSGLSDDQELVFSDDFFGEPFRAFSGGVIQISEDLISTGYRHDIGPWSRHGLDGLAYYRLFAPGYEVTRHVCQTTRNSEVYACPGGTQKQDIPSNINDIRGVRLTCGVDVELEWHIRPSSSGSSFGLNIPLEDIDVNGDGFINTTDLVFCIDEWGQTGGDLACDVTDDNIVDARDVSLVTGSQGLSVDEDNGL